MESELFRPYGQWILDHRNALRKGDCWVVPLDDLAHCVCPLAQAKGGSYDGQIKLAQLPPCVARMLVFNFQYTNAAQLRVDNQTVGLAPAHVAPAVEKLEPLPRDEAVGKAISKIFLDAAFVSLTKGAAAAVARFAAYERWRCC